MVKNWNVSQMLPVPFTKWHFQISPHLHPFTVRCYFPYVNKRWFITPPRGKQILLNEVAGIFFCRRMNKHFPACHWGFFFQVTCMLIILSLPSVSEEKGSQGTPRSFSSGYRGGVVSRQGGTPAPWKSWSDQAQCSQIISFTFLHYEVHVWNLPKIILNRVDSVLSHRLS